MKGMGGHVMVLVGLLGRPGAGAIAAGAATGAMGVLGIAPILAARRRPSPERVGVRVGGRSVPAARHPAPAPAFRRPHQRPDAPGGVDSVMSPQLTSCELSSHESS